MRRPNAAIRSMLAIALALVAAAAIAAQEGTDRLSLDITLGYSPPDLDGFGSTGFAPIDFSTVPGGAGERDLGSSWGGGAALATLTYARNRPALVGEGPLLSGNHLEMAAKAELSPVTLEAYGYLTLTPVAFLNFQAGASIGTGWSLGFVGLALVPTIIGDPIDEIPFGGAVLKAWASGTFQFDLVALRPGDWNHILVQATARFEYRNNTAAQAQEAWIWQADAGKNYDGWRHLGTYVLGYQMPRKLNFAGLMLETEAYIGAVRGYGPMASNGWGSDFVTLTLSPLANLALDEKSSLTFLVQIKSTQDWTDYTTRYLALQNRVYEGRLFCLDRILVSYSRRLR